MTFAQRRSRLTTHFPECIPVFERLISVLVYIIWVCVSNLYDVRTRTKSPNDAESIPVVKRHKSEVGYTI